MSNGHACCILGVCCPPGTADTKRVQALADELERAVGLSPLKGEESTGTGYAVAEWMLQNYGLVPKGMDMAIVEMYRPQFAKLNKKE